MSAESNARSHVDAFRWWVGNTDITEAEATLRDLAAIRDAADDAIRAVIHDARQDWGAGTLLTWAQIAAPLRISRQAAQQRYGRG